MVRVFDAFRLSPVRNRCSSDPRIIRDETLNILLAGRDTVRLHARSVYWVLLSASH